MKVRLSEPEQRLARYVAQRRYSANRSQGVTNAKIGPQADAQIDLDGVAAELVVCKALNVYPDLELDDWPDEDLISRSGHRIDVKATRYHGGKLLARLTKKGSAVDFYCLVVGEFPCYRIAGLMGAGDLLSEARVSDLGHGPTYSAAQAELQSVDEWLFEYEQASSLAERETPEQPE